MSKENVGEGRKKEGRENENENVNGKMYVNENRLKWVLVSGRGLKRGM